MDKQTLLGQFRTAINRVQLAYASIVLWSHPDMPDFFSQFHAELGAKVKPFAQVTQMVKDDSAMRIACEDLYNVAFLSAVADLFSVTTDYCHRTGQSAKLKAQPWFAFWRILRNCSSHARVFNFNPAERAMLPVSWAGLTIDIAMNHQPMMLKRFPREKMMQLLQAVMSFVGDDLT